ncbi:Wzz/FepE/Etk N-terminal domain-containing protein [Candidatus Bipolaricaulota bacterium]|nr:Wzz/FepE/Etk N-terminal domain-containing protein [Candidatus Bipolaricaulota bacterium]
MDEYEIELIDYLRVIWRRKWIIIVCMVVTLAVTAGIVWTQPNEYAGTVSYRLHDRSTHLLAPNIHRLPHAIDVVETISLREGLRLIETSTRDLVHVTLTGVIPPNDLPEQLDRFTTHLYAELTARFQAEKDRATAESAFRIDQTTKQLDLLEERMDALTTPDDPLLPFLAKKVVDLEVRIVTEQVRLDILRETEADALLTLETVRISSITRTGPNRTMPLAVAGVLGIFAGLLLAFFVQYLSKH